MRRIYDELLPIFGIYKSKSPIFGIYDSKSQIFGAYDKSLFPSSLSLSLLPTPSLPTTTTVPIFNFRSGVAGCFLLVFIVSSVFIIVTTVNNNIYNYSYKYKKKLKLLNQISNWKKKKNRSRPTKPNSVLLRPTNSALFRPTNQVLVSKWQTKKNQRFRPNTSIDLLRDLFFAWNNRKKTSTNSILLLNPLLLLLNPLLLLLRVRLTTPVLLRLPLLLLNRPKTKNCVPLRPTNLLLLLLAMSNTYTVAANELQGIIVCFEPHPNPAFPYLHRTLNDVYGLDLHDDEFHFLFHDVTNNRQKELY